MGKWIHVDDIKGEITTKLHFLDFYIKEYKKLKNPTKQETEEYRENVAKVVALESLIPYIDDFSFTLEEINANFKD